MELVLNDLSMVGQFKDYEEFEGYFIRVLNRLLEMIAEKQIPLYKLPDIFEKEVAKGVTLHQMLLTRKNHPAAAILRKRIMQILDNPFLVGEWVKTVKGVFYGYPGKTEEPNCFTEAIERKCPLLSFPEPHFMGDSFSCFRDNVPLSVPNIKEIGDLLDFYLSEAPWDIRYILVHYPFPQKVILAEINHKCYLADALTDNHLSCEDIRKIIGHIPDLIRDWTSGKKTHWWDSIEEKIYEYRVTISGGREFRIFFLWKEGLILMNGFVKKTQATPSAEKKKARLIAAGYK